MENVSYKQFEINTPIHPTWLYLLFLTIIMISIYIVIELIFNKFFNTHFSLIPLLVIVLSNIYIIKSNYIRIYDNGKVVIKSIFKTEYMISDIKEIHKIQSYKVEKIKIDIIFKKKNKSKTFYISEEEIEQFIKCILRHNVNIKVYNNEQ